MKFDETKGPGRVFFSHEDSLELDWVAYQPLQNHVENVRTLMKGWRTDTETFDLAIDASRLEQLYEGAAYHDWGKTQKFAIKKKGEGWTYSYAGHRFLNPPEFEDIYNLTLERAHHDYSTEEIAKDAYELKYKGIDYENYPKDLFVLEMCDQIEAEVAVMAVQDLDEGRNSSFMEFEVERIGTSGNTQTFSLEPFPFDKVVNYEVIVRRDRDVEGEALSASDLKRRGFAPYESLERITIQLRRRHESNEEKFSSDDITKFYQRVGGFSPNSLQEEVWRYWKADKDDSEEKSVGLIVKAPTGTGKTEACIYPALAQNKRVVLVLPAKALVDDHKERFKGVLHRLSEADEKLRHLLVDTGDSTELYAYDGETKDPEPRTDNRHLYRADVILTTLDKFIYRFFGYGGGRKSYTYPLRISNRSRMAFVFDEAHSYEGTSFTNFQRLANTLYDNGHNITLMTATLPEAYQKALQDPEDFGFEGRWDVVDFLEAEEQNTLTRGEHYGEYYGERHLSYLPDEGKAWDAGLEADAYDARREAFDTHKEGRIARITEQVEQHWMGRERLIVTLDRVVDAAEVYKYFRDKAGLPTLLTDSQNPQLFLYHGRLDRQWRSEVYRALKARDDAKEPYLLISTSAIEIGVDLDAQILVTELCNPDSLVQRMGRCNRKGKIQDAQVIVVGSQIPTYLDTFGENRAAFGAYLSHLETHHKQKISSGFSEQIMGDFPKPVLSDPRAATAYDMLHRYVYDFDLEYHNLHQLGFIATRSWEPALEVRIPYKEGNLKDKETKLHFDSIQVPVGRMSRSTDDAAWVKIEQYRWERNADKSWQGKWEEATRGGDLYRNSYRIWLLKESELCQEYEKDLGLIDLPQIFQRQHWSNDPPLKTRLRTWGFEEEQTEGGALFFASDKVEGKSKGKSLVFSYLADPELLTEV